MNDSKLDGLKNITCGLRRLMQWNCYRHHPMEVLGARLGLVIPMFLCESNKTGGTGISDTTDDLRPFVRASSRPRVLGASASDLIGTWLLRTWLLRKRKHNTLLDSAVPPIAARRSPVVTLARIWVIDREMCCCCKCTVSMLLGQPAPFTYFSARSTGHDAS